MPEDRFFVAGRVSCWVYRFLRYDTRIFSMCFLDGNEISARFYGRHLRIRDRASTRARGFHPPGNIHPRAGLLHSTLPLPPFVPLPRDNLVTGDTYPLNPQEACLRTRHLIVHRTGLAARPSVSAEIFFQPSVYDYVRRDEELRG